MELSSLKETIERSFPPDIRNLNWGFDLREDWSSRTTGHRLAIRQALQARFASQATSDLLDLKSVPLIRDFSVSISHSPALGGFVWAELNPALGALRGLGLDVEVAGRVKPETLTRFGSAAEIEANSTLLVPPTAIWAAREAAFKSLRGSPFEQQVISGVETTQWVKFTPYSFQFTAQVQTKAVGRGISWLNESCAIAVFFHFSS